MRRNNRYAIVFTCCLLAMPTCVELLSSFTSDSIYTSLIMGALLGATHLALRPIIRVLTAPIGCLTLGLIQPVIDVGLIYLCDHFVEGFAVGDPLDALLAVVLINVITFIAAGRR